MCVLSDVHVHHETTLTRLRQSLTLELTQKGHHKVVTFLLKLISRQVIYLILREVEIKLEIFDSISQGQPTTINKSMSPC